MLKSLQFLLLFLVSVSIAKAQATLEKCGSTLVHGKLTTIHPEIIAQFQQNEKKIQAKIANNNHLKSTEKVYTIPIVVHVIHLGEAVGVGNNISDAQIISGIQQLNDAYRNVNGLSVDTKIEFALAKIDNNCNPSTGIVRINGSGVTGYSSGGVKMSSVGADELSIKNLSRWSNNDFYNIWLVSEFEGNNGGNGVQGFAYFPGTSSDYDGAMIMNTAWGNTGTVNSWNNQGSTGIHEIGHALNLYHTFEGDENPITFESRCPMSSSGCGMNAGDCCDDTSPHIRSSSDCKTSSTNTCTGLINDDVIHNYMDYSNQSCQFMFTQNQKTRMRTALEVSRKGLINSKALNEGISFNTPIAAACTPITNQTGLSGSFLGILNVEFNNLNYASNYTNVDGGYLNVSDQCLLSAEIDKDSSYYLKVNVGLNSNHVKAWIDYNNDGSFDETSELILNKNISADGVDSALVTAPIGATTDTYLRLRVMNDFGQNSVSNSCENPFYGQAEDYAILIRSLPLPINTIEKESSFTNFVIAPNPFNDFVTVSYAFTNNSNTEYSLLDLSGAEVLKGTIPANEMVTHYISTEQLKAGSYILLLQNQGSKKSTKIIKVL